MKTITFLELITFAEKHNAIAISQPRKSNHSFTGYCCDVFFDLPESFTSFSTEIEATIGIFVASSYEEEYVRARVPVIPF